MGTDTRKLTSLLHYWFVKYNPLYFFSALCVLCGIFLNSQGLDQVGWTQGKVILTLVVETYQVFLIAAAALLFRGARQHRPAVILGLVEVVFLLDCTFQTEVLATLERPFLAVAWIGMVAFKLTALVWAFRLKASLVAFLVPFLAALAIGATPPRFSTRAGSRVRPSICS